MSLLHRLIGLYIWVLIITALLSWVPNAHGALGTVKRTLARITEPVLLPLRRILPRPNFGGVGLDLSVIVAILLLEVINAII